MIKRSKIILFTLVIATFFIASSLTTIGLNLENTSTDSVPYNGDLKVYVVEPSSRWDNYDRDPYHYGFLDFALEESLSIEYQDTYTTQVTWDASAAGYSNINENNLMVIATIFSPEVSKGYSYPPFQNPFDAHYVDATAGAEPGETGYNTVNEDFTHTVFVEEATATWCPHCPVMAEALNDIYQSGDYPFYFVAMIADMADDAENRLIQDYNIYGYPSAYFDGGQKVIVGGYDDESYYRTRIEQCGARDVHELALNVTVGWLGGGDLDISVTITNNEEIINTAPETPTITGEISGAARKEYKYTISTVDPDGDDVFYWILWFEGCPGVTWEGPYDSGEEVVFPYTWDEKGTHTISVKSKDSKGSESDWATLEVSMPKAKSFSIVSRFKNLERFPIISVFLKNLLKI